MTDYYIYPNGVIHSSVPNLRLLSFGNNFSALSCVHIRTNIPISFGDNVTLSKDATVICESTLDGNNKGVVVGNHVTFGGDVYFSPGVTVEDGCIFGSGKIYVSPNVRIGRNSVLSRGCRVLQNVPPNSLVVGEDGFIIKKSVIE